MRTMLSKTTGGGLARDSPAAEAPLDVLHDCACDPVDLSLLHEFAKLPKGQPSDLGRLAEARFTSGKGLEGFSPAIFIRSQVQQLSERGRPIESFFPHELFDEELRFTGDSRGDRDLRHVRIVYNTDA